MVDLAPGYSPSGIVADHLSRGVPVDLEGMARDLGVNVVTTSLPDTIAGKLERDRSAPAGFRAVINARDSHRRRRFTLAHEIAHYILHRDLIEDSLVDSALYRSSLSDEFERQADRYAATLILPATAVKEAYRKDKALVRLAQMFDVSDAALRIRLRELNLGA